MRYFGTFILVFVLTLACGGDDKKGDVSSPDTVSTDTDEDATSPDINGDVSPPACDPAQTTYHRDVRPLVVSYCNDCHSPIGGQVFAGDAYDWSYWTDPDPDDKLIQGVSTWAPAMVADVENRTMPPWPMVDGCRTIQGSRTMSQADIDVFKAWRDNDYCQGDAVDFVDPGWTPPDNNYDDAGITTASSEAWTLPASITEKDVFRCYRLDANFEKDTWVSGYATTADTPMAHHSLVYVIAPGDISKVDSLDTAFDGVGWGDCDNGIGVNGSVVSGWVPGAGKVTYPTDSALLIPKGSILVMQMHYSGVGATEEELKDNTDQTQIHFWTLDEGEVPSRRVVLKSWSNQTFKIPLGETQVVSQAKDGPPSGSKIFGIVPHMHNLGTAIRLEVNHADGTDSCLARIGFNDQNQVCGEDGVDTCSMWDFDWQYIYSYDENDQVTTGPGDKVSVHCNYPYTNEHVAKSLGLDAPTAQDCSDNNKCAAGTCKDGKCTNPDPLVWGEASYEEMCIAFLFYTVPYAEGDTFEGCATECSGDANCLLDCIITYQTKDCDIVGQLQACGASECPSEAQALNQCLAGCDLGSPLSCIRNSQKAPPCWDAYEAFATCTWAAIESEACDGPSCL